MSYFPPTDRPTYPESTNPAVPSPPMKWHAQRPPLPHTGHLHHYSGTYRRYHEMRSYYTPSAVEGVVRVLAVAAGR